MTAEQHKDSSLTPPGVRLWDTRLAAEKSVVQRMSKVAAARGSQWELSTGTCHRNPLTGQITPHCMSRWTQSSLQQIKDKGSFCGNQKDLCLALVFSFSLEPHCMDVLAQFLSTSRNGHREHAGDFTGMWDPPVPDFSCHIAETWTENLLYLRHSRHLFSHVSPIFLLPIFPPPSPGPRDAAGKWCFLITFFSAPNSLTISNLSIFLLSLFPVVTSLWRVLCEKFLSWIQKHRQNIYNT